MALNPEHVTCSADDFSSVDISAESPQTIRSSFSLLYYSQVNAIRVYLGPDVL